MGNWRRREPDPQAKALPGCIVVTSVFSDLVVLGVGSDGIATQTVATARAMAWQGFAPLAHAREFREIPTKTSPEARTRIELYAPDVAAPSAVRETWDAFTQGKRSGAEMIMAGAASLWNTLSRAFSGSTDRIPDGTPIRGAGVAEIYVRFRDWQIYYQPCKTGMVATARVASWLARYPLASVRETSGQVLIVLIEIDEDCPDQFKTMEPV